MELVQYEGNGFLGSRVGGFTDGNYPNLLELLLVSQRIADVTSSNAAFNCKQNLESSAWGSDRTQQSNTL